MINALAEPPQPEIELTLSPKQELAFDLLDNPLILEVVYGGGGRSGKTYLGANYFILKCLECEGSAWLIARESLKKLKRTTLLTFFKALRDMGLKEGLDWKFNAQENILRFSRANGLWDGGSVIFFEEMRKLPSDPEFDRFGSYDLSGGWIDECQEVHFSARDILQTRYSVLSGVNCDGTTWKLEKGVTLLTCNPKRNWIYSDFVKPQKDGTIEEHRAFLPALYSDNPFINREAYRRGILATKNKILIERLLKGNFDYDDDPRLLFELDSINDLWTNIVGDDDPDGKGKKADKYLIVDAARLGGDYIVAGYFEGLDLKRVYYWKKARTNVSAEKIIGFRDKHRIPASHVLIDEDGIGGGIIDQVPGSKGFLNGGKVIQSRKQKLIKDDLEKSSITINYGNLKTQCWFKLAEMVADGLMRISEDDPTVKEKIIEDLSVIKEKDSGTDSKIYIISKDEIKELLGRSSDFGDILMMRMYFELKPPSRFAAISV